VGTARARARNNCEMPMLSQVIATLFFPQYFSLSHLYIFDKSMPTSA